MRLQKNGINLLLVGEVLLLIAVIIFGVLNSVGGTIKNHINDSEKPPVVSQPEDDTQETENNSQSEEEGKDLPWNIPENYTEARVQFSEAVEAKLLTMTTEQKVAQLFIVTPEALTGVNNVTRFGNVSRDAMNRYPVGGLAYGVTNFQGAAQAATLIKSAKDYSQTQFGYGLFTVALEEVSREGLLQTGEINLVKDMESFPGAEASGMTFAELCNSKLPAYQGAFAAGARFLFVDTDAIEGITGDSNVSCVLSSRTAALLRGSMNYEGVLITENLLEMDSAACVSAIQAGMDMLYMPANFIESYNAVVEAVNNGTITEERLHNAVGRVLSAKGL